MYRLDMAAHKIMRFWDSRMFDIDDSSKANRYISEYHEERLYSVYDRKTGVVSLVWAYSHSEAIKKIKERSR